MSEDTLLETPEGTPDTEVTETEQPDKFDFVLDKYRAEGRSEEESLQLQAKSYGELQSKFGAFTGAPEGYEVALPDDLKDVVDIDPEDPLFSEFSKWAKDSNLSQDGFNSLIEAYSRNEIAKNGELDVSREEELESLGTNASQRIEGINKFITANFDDETVNSIKSMATTGESIKAIEALIKRGSAAPMAQEDATPAPAVSESDVRDMQFAKDEHGNRKISTDPAYRKEYERKRDILYGTGENRQMIG